VVLKFYAQKYAIFGCCCLLETDSVNYHGQLTLHHCGSAKLTSWNNNQSLQDGKMDWEANTEKIYSLHNATA